MTAGSNRSAFGVWRCAAALSSAIMLAPAVHGGVVITNSLEAWLASAGPNITHLDFVGLVPPVPVQFTTQYAQFGVSDSQDNDFVFASGSPDGWGLYGDNPLHGFGIDKSITLDLAGPIQSFAHSYHVGTGRHIQLLLGGVLQYELDLAYFSDGPGVAGVVSDLPFDRVKIWGKFWATGSPLETGKLDDIWFGTIPVPSGSLIFIMAGLRNRRRRAG